ncbi:GDP-D-glucose phosphorylase 1 [Leguminivora glycinivorella]|uniref:GDP-D-glucose phosphorylase 1 n=1 Tax=Leguminivora glycinivorella TaxID=1035111 RepID=UPI00200E8937|nr:GDP-D-glucose phosphorylase 1 [Leguminivora glycinivorella]XP_047998459.1 GDP-D-glucose phosphorylase 1 [Leguminivora glycinivorella]XP_047998460.1 GDP-D-glucose phosphorylase 1 [Leguminivora glycinivorella]
MFTIKIPSNCSDSAQEIKNIDSETFKQLLKTKWDEIHDQTDAFRYKINKMRERIVDNRYILLLNPERGFKRREPEFIDNIHKPYNPDEFNFNKTSSKEHLFTMHENNSTDTHLFLVNVSPISRYHTLLCPSVNRRLPQVVTEDSIRLVLDVKCFAQDRDLKIGFNSLCAFASVNHLHYHMMYEKNTFHVATDKCVHLKGPLYLINNIVPAFCFQVTKETKTQAVQDIFRLTEYLVSKSIGHNILVTDGEPVVPKCNNVLPECKHVLPECNEMVPSINDVVPRSNDKVPGCIDKVPGCNDMVPRCNDMVPRCNDTVPGCKEGGVVRVLVTPRLSTAGVKALTSFNVAVLELSGWFPVFNPEYFDTFSAADLEQELSKWKLPHFEELSEEVKSLY